MYRKCLGPVVRKAAGANPGLEVKLGFDFSCVKAYVRAKGCGVLFQCKTKLKEIKYKQQTICKAIKLNQKIYSNPGPLA